jgi:hypothetical protein
MKNESLEGLNLEERRPNLAYQVVQRIRPNAKRILALPDLLDIMASPALLCHMTQLWYSDAVAAAGAEAAAATIEKALVNNALLHGGEGFLAGSGHCVGEGGQGSRSHPTGFESARQQWISNTSPLVLSRAKPTTSASSFRVETRQMYASMIEALRV